MINVALLSTALLILTLAVGLALLLTGGYGLVRGASSLSVRLHIPPVVVGLAIVATCTSMPELFGPS